MTGVHAPTPRSMASRGRGGSPSQASADAVDAPELERLRLSADAERIVSCLPYPLIVFDGGISRYANPALCHLIGARRDETVGRRVEEIFAVTESHQSASQFLCALRHRNGSLLPIRASFLPLAGPREPRPTYGGVLCIVRNALNGARARRAPREAQSRTAADVRLPDPATPRFTTDRLIHDLNNDLQAILGNLSLARDDVGEVGRNAARVERTAAAALRARDRLREYSAHIKAPGPPRRFVSLHAAMNNAADHFRTNVGDEAVEVRCEHGLGAGLILGDEAALTELMVAMLLSANEAERSHKGVVRISTSFAFVEDTAAPAHGLRPGRYLRLRMEDDGPGLGEDALRGAPPPGPISNPESDRGFLLELLDAVARQHSGAVAFSAGPGSATAVDVLLPDARANAR